MSLGLTATLVALASLSSYASSTNTPTSDGDFGKDDKRKFEPGNRAQHLRGGYFGLQIPDYHSHGDSLPAYDGKTRTEGATKGQKRLTRAQRKAANKAKQRREAPSRAEFRDWLLGIDRSKP